MTDFQRDFNGYVECTADGRRMYLSKVVELGPECNNRTLDFDDLVQIARSQGAIDRLSDPCR